MANLTGTPGAYGRRPRDFTRPALVFEDYTGTAEAGQLPEPPHPDVDRCSEITDWPMYVNGPDPGNPGYARNGLGVCTIAGAFHGISALSFYAGNGLVTFSNDEVIKVYCDPSVGDYKEGDPGTDNGATLQSVLEYGRQTGFTDTTGKVHKILVYAALGDPADQGMLGRALYTFGSVYAGGELPASAETEFPGMWTWPPGGAQDAGGHCTAFQRRGYGGTGVDWYVSWGAAVQATRGFTYHYLAQGQGGEAWAFATQDWVEMNGYTPTGLDVTQWLADMQHIS